MQRNTQTHSGNHDGSRRAPRLARLLRMLARLIEGKSANATWDDSHVLALEDRVESPLPDGPLPPTIVDLEAVDHLLADLHRRGIKANVGKIQMVHIGAIRAAFGDNWNRYAARAMELAEGVLHQYLDPTDIYSRYENFAFIVVFSDLDEAYARERAAAISLEIQYRLLHDPMLAKRVSVTSVAARIVDMLGDEVPPTVGALSQEFDRKSKEKRALKNPGLAKPRRSCVGKLPQGMGIFAPAYRPMLYLPDRTISTYVAVHRSRLKDGIWLVDEAAYPVGQAGDLTLEFDELLMRRVAADLRNTIVESNDAFVGTMVNISSLNTSSPLFRRLHLLDNRSRDQFVIEIVGVQSGTPLGLLVEVVGSLRPFTKRVNLRLPLFYSEIEHLSSVGLHSVGCDISAPKLQHRRTSEIAEAMESFVEQAKAGDFHTLFHGVSTTEQFATAVKVGADYLTGDAVAPYIASPAAPLRFEQLEHVFPAQSGLDGPSVTGSTTLRDVAS